jgi:predicted aspartyl protease
MKTQPPPIDTPKEPTISLHVLTSIHLRSNRTMQLVVNINGTRLTALLNSGSTHNFVDVEAAARAGIQLGAP